MTVPPVPESPRFTPPILYVIVTLLVLNLALTIWLIAEPRSLPRDLGSDTPPLPSELTTAERMRLFETLQEAFNARDIMALYDVMGPLAQIQVTIQDMKKEADKMFRMFETITSGAYSHHLFIGSSGSQLTFQLVFRVRFGSEEIPQGVVLINIMTVPSGYQVVGFRVNTP